MTANMRAVAQTIALVRAYDLLYWVSALADVCLYAAEFIRARMPHLQIRTQLIRAHNTYTAKGHASDVMRCREHTHTHRQYVLD